MYELCITIDPTITEEVQYLKKKKKEEENMLLINVSVQGYGNAVLTASCVKTPIQGNDHKDGIIESYHP